MADIVPEHAKRVEARMRQLRFHDTPWWYSGSACIAALMWLAFLAAILASFFGYVERQASNSLTVILLLVLAVVFSALAAGKR